MVENPDTYAVSGASAPEKPRLIRRMLLAAVAAALFVAEPALAGATRARILVLPVVVHSIENQDYLRSGIADMLSTRLEQIAGLEVVRGSDPAQATTDVEAARSAAKTAGADFVLFGSFTHFGEGASLDLQCARLTAAPGADGARQVFVQAGTLGDIIPKLDELADRVGRYVAGGANGSPAVASAPPSGPGASKSELDELRRRVEALERNAGIKAAGGPATTHMTEETIPIPAEKN
jgi:TolB-like protein